MKKKWEVCFSEEINYIVEVEADSRGEAEEKGFFASP